MDPIEALHAKSEISEIIARYGHYADHQDWDAILDLFADDAVFDTSTVYGRSWQGKAELREFYVNARIAVAHHVTPPFTDLIDDRTARSRAKMLVFWRRQVFSVDYAWRFVKPGERWLIGELAIEIVGKAEFAVAPPAPSTGLETSRTSETSASGAVGASGEV